MEVYVAGATNRFVTITGNVLQKLDIVENLDGFQWLLETYMKRENSKTTIIQQERESYLTDESIIEKTILKKYADDNGFINTEFFVDDGVSGLHLIDQTFKE